MSLKIFHISDVHIGMRFYSYPEGLREKLIQARFQSLKNAVAEADQRKSDLFVITGDLFESLKVSRQDMKKVCDILQMFQGEQILILPGNHDYFDPNIDFWDNFSKDCNHNLLLLKKCGRTDISIGEMQISIYAAPCDKKHSSANRLSFLEEEKIDTDKINILLAHGAILDISPDLKEQYFPMSLAELVNKKMDLCLIGHTHVPYPQEGFSGPKVIFNPGTPEPDGLDYRYEGNGFYIEIDKQKSIQYESVTLGSYRFIDHRLTMGPATTYESIMRPYLKKNPSSILLRLHIDGYMEKEFYENRNELYRKLESQFAYLIVDDSALRVRFTQDLLDKEFIKDSLPYVFLKRVIEEEGENTAHLAYEFMTEVKDID